MRSLVAAAVAVAAGQTSEQLAECLNREGFRPVSNREDRFTPSRARQLVYRLGLDPRCRSAEPLGPDEWWLRDLADKLGLSYHRLKNWEDYWCRFCFRGRLLVSVLFSWKSEPTPIICSKCDC